MRLAGNIPVKIERIVEESPTVKRFTLVPTVDDRLPAFTGGSHLKTFITTADGKLIEREYSLVSHPQNRAYYEIAISKDTKSRGGSVYWHEVMAVGDELEVTFPRNYFALNSFAKNHAFYASGIGITPFLAMMEDIQFDQTFELHYAARTPEECAFYEELQQRYGDKVNFYFSRVEEPNRLCTELMKEHRIGTHVYFCGPVAMVEEFRDAALAYGYPEKAVHFELFSTGQDTGERNAFTVALTDSQKEIEVQAEETLLDALLREGINAPFACKIGGCGSCEVEVVDGEVDHRDHFLSNENKAKRKSILTCCSRAKEQKLSLKL